MYTMKEHWNPKQAALRDMICKPERFAEAMALCRELHGMVHQSGGGQTLADEVAKNLPDKDCAVMPTGKDVTIAWNLWHITRIEDITMNILVAGGPQVLNGRWLGKLGTTVTDTGNAMSDEEILALSGQVSMGQLWQYRAAVAQKSRAILDSLTPEDMRRKFSLGQAQRILDEGCVTTHPDSIWLQDFWARKDVVGILLLPLMRHQAGHLNDCLRLKKRIAKA